MLGIFNFLFYKIFKVGQTLQKCATSILNCSTFNFFYFIGDVAICVDYLISDGIWFEAFKHFLFIHNDLSKFIWHFMLSKMFGRGNFLSNKVYQSSNLVATLEWMNVKPNLNISNVLLSSYIELGEGAARSP